MCRGREYNDSRVRGGYLPPGAVKCMRQIEIWQQKNNNRRHKTATGPAAEKKIKSCSVQGVKRDRKLRTVTVCGVECKHQTSYPTPPPDHTAAANEAPK